MAGDKSPGECIMARGDKKACLLIWFILMQVENTAFSSIHNVAIWLKEDLVCFIYVLFVFR